MLGIIALLVVFSTTIVLSYKNEFVRNFVLQWLGTILGKTDEFLHSDWSKKNLGQYASVVKGYVNMIPLLTLKEDEEIQQLPENIRNVLIGSSVSETSSDDRKGNQVEDGDASSTLVNDMLKERVEESKDFLDPLRRIGVERKESVRKLVSRFESQLDLKSPSDNRGSTGYTGKKHPSVVTDQKHTGPVDVKPVVPVKKPDVPPTKPVKKPDVPPTKPAPKPVVIPLEESKPFRDIVKSFLEHDEDYVLHLGRLLPDCYQKPIQQFRKQHDPENNEERSYELLEILFNKLAKQMASDPSHMKLFTLKRSIVFEKPLSHDAKALKIMSEMVMHFVKDTLCKKYIPYVGEYIGIRPKIQLLFNDVKAMKVYIREELDAASAKIQKADKSFIKVLNLEDMIAEPCRRLTIYLTTFRDEWYPYFKEAQVSTKIEKTKEDQDIINEAVVLLENACSKLEREMKNNFMQLEKAFQMNKIYEIQRKIGMDSLANETADVLLSNSVLAMKNQKEKSEELMLTERMSSIPNFIYESMNDTEFLFCLGKDGKRKTNFAYEGYLLENMFILSGIDMWEGRRHNKVFNLKGCSVEAVGEKEIRLTISGQTKRFECQTPRARQRWLSCLLSVCETGFFSTETAKKLAQHIRQHSSVGDSPQDYYAIPLEELYSAPQKWSCFDNNDYNVLYEKTDEQTTKKPIRAASLEKLVQMLTSPERFDQSFLFSFMLTYQSFTTSEELIQMLSNRYNTPPPQDKSNDKSFIQFKETILFPVRIRVCQVLKHWIQHHSYVFRADPRVRNKLSQFIEQHIAKTKLFSLADELRDDLEKYAQKRDTFTEQQLKMLSQKVNALQLTNPSKQSKSVSLAIDAPKPRMPRSLKSFTSRGRRGTTVSSVSDWSSVEIARQLTLIEFAIYESIQVKECLNQAWSRELAPNLKAMIDRTNLIVLFVGYEVLKQESQSNRVHTVQKWIKVGRECRKINNLNACREIVGGLKQVAVSRLTKTWDKVDAKLKKEFEELSTLVSQNKNYKAMRSALSSCPPPCIPYVGVYLRDLTFIDEGNKDMVANTNDKPKSPNPHAPYKPELINFFKRQKIGVIIRDLQQYQNTPYIFVCVPELANRLQNIVSVPEDKLIELSLAAEPEDN